MQMDKKQQQQKMQRFKTHLYGYRKWLVDIVTRYSDEINTSEMMQVELELCNIINSLNNCIEHLIKKGDFNDRL